MIGKRRLLAATAGLLVAGGARAQPVSRPRRSRSSCRARRAAASDNLARLLQPGLEKKLGVSDHDRQPARRRGDAWAPSIVAKAKPDGYTFLLADNSLLPEPGDPRFAALRHAEGLQRRHHGGAGAGDPDRPSRRAGQEPARS